MKHLQTYEDSRERWENMEDRTTTGDYLYLVKWANEGYEIVNEGYIQRNSFKYSEDGGDDLNLIERIMNLDVDDMIDNNEIGDQAMNGYVEWIKKIPYQKAEIDEDIITKIQSKKYNL